VFAPLGAGATEAAVPEALKLFGAREAELHPLRGRLLGMACVESAFAASQGVCLVLHVRMCKEAPSFHNWALSSAFNQLLL